MKITPLHTSSTHAVIKSFIIFMLTTTTVEAQLTGAIRERFLHSYLSGCYRIQLSASQNKEVPDEVLKQYCRCLGIYVANTGNNGLVKEIEEGNVSIDVITPVSKMAEKYCIKNYQKY